MSKSVTLKREYPLPQIPKNTPVILSRSGGRAHADVGDVITLVETKEGEATGRTTKCKVVEKYRTAGGIHYIVEHYDPPEGGANQCLK